MELGKKIRQLRFKAGFTQEQLADRMGVAPQSVSKWENAAAMPDITALPLLAEVFGVSIDDLFDLSNEQRLNRIENRMDVEEELPQDVFWEYEEFLKAQLLAGENKKRALDLICYLYWHRMNTYAQKVRRYARDAIRLSPGEKNCQWMLQQAEHHAVWDWNIANHTKAIDFYRELAEADPSVRLPYWYLLDNLIADHRTDEADGYLARVSALEGTDPNVVKAYRARIALARFDEPEADRIIADMVETSGEDSVCLFEAAQYFAIKCDYDRAVEYYERSFAAEKRRPRFQDELQGIADIWEIRGDYKKAADTWGRIVDLLENEWHLTEETELLKARKERARLMEKASNKNRASV